MADTTDKNDNEMWYPPYHYLLSRLGHIYDLRRPELSYGFPKVYMGIITFVILIIFKRARVLFKSVNPNPQNVM